MSAFVDVSEIRHALDIKLRHDQTVALWRLYRGTLELVRYWELERISAIKQHPKAMFGRKAFDALLARLLAEEGLGLDDIRAIWGTRGVETDDSYRAGLADDLTFHTMAHLLTAICFDRPEPFAGPLIALAVDAGPDSLFEADAHLRNYYAGCVIVGDDVDIFPIASPGRLWSASRRRFGLREGTLMALASATPATFPLTVEEPLPELVDEAARFDAYRLIDDLASRSEDMEPTIEDPSAWPDAGRFSSAELRLSALMKIVAEISERVMVRNIDRICSDFDIDPAKATLALAGGFALNCPTNSALMQRYRFVDLRIPPCTSDCGIALGTGLAGFLPELRSGTATVDLSTAYAGQGAGTIEDEVAPHEELIEAIETVDAREVAETIAREGLVVWVCGRAEMGPRALGARSLIADPRSLEVRNRLNQIKSRQWWRPVAPIVLHEHGSAIFNDYRFSPYMLLNFGVSAEWLERIAGVIHLDGTARVQSVTTDRNPHLAGVVEAFHDLTGVPVVGNTSLNAAGEPIIGRLGDAIAFASEKGVRSVIFEGGTRLRVRPSPAGRTRPRPRDGHLFDAGSGADDVRREMSAHELSVEELTYFYDRMMADNDEADLRSDSVRDEVRAATSAFDACVPGALRR